MDSTKKFGKVIYQDSNEHITKRKKIIIRMIVLYVSICILLLFCGILVILWNLFQFNIISIILGIAIIIMSLTLLVVTYFIFNWNYNETIELYENGILVKNKTNTFIKYSDIEELKPIDKYYDPIWIESSTRRSILIGRSHIQSYKPEDYDKFLSILRMKCKDCSQ